MSDDQGLEDGSTQDGSKSEDNARHMLNNEGEENGACRSQRKAANDGAEQKAHNEREESKSQRLEESPKKAADGTELRGVEDAADHVAKDSEVRKEEETEMNAGEEKKEQRAHEESESEKLEELAEESDHEIEIEQNRRPELPAASAGRKTSQRRGRGRQEEFGQQKAKWSTLFILSCNCLVRTVYFLEVSKGRPLIM